VTASRRVAALDIGTNTCLLLVAEGAPEAPVAVLERATITRLGKGVDRSGRLADDAIERTARALSGYAEEIRRSGAASIDAVCTSAARDAANGAEFLERATRALGVTPRIIDGDEEARLTFDGALTGLRTRSAVTVFDIGGGSTELIHGSRGDTTVILDALSMDIGSVRLTERHITHDPPTVSELDAVRRDALAALARAPRSLRPAGESELVGVAGTITTLSAIDKSLSVYDAALVHGATLSRTAIATQIDRLASVNLEERKRVTGLDPGRADVIVAGAIIALAVLDWAELEHVRVSDRGVRWGLASRALLAASGSVGTT
jgi:exopolyphosphatase/guanosine-5'-triphosphate,3'-diphosphate pyrophosphatase